MRIDRAFCIELNKEVDIFTAREEFFAQNEVKKFNFICSDPECRAKQPKPVQIKAALHNSIPDERNLSVSPYFGTFPFQEHVATCEWVELDEALKKKKKASGLAQELEDFKNTKLITLFIPESESDDQDLIFHSSKSVKSIKEIENKDERLEARYQKFAKNGSTTRSLDCLISFYDYAKSIDKLYTRLDVKGFGSFQLWNLFNHINNYFETKNFSIFYGGATLKKIYPNKSFSLRFYDKINNLPIHLYVSAKDINSCPRVGHYLLRILAELKRNESSNPYLKVFFIGELIKSEEVNSYGVKLTNLNNLSMRLVFPKSAENGSS